MTETKLPDGFARFQKECVKIAQGTDRNSRDEHYSYIARAYCQGNCDGVLRALGLAYEFLLDDLKHIDREGRFKIIKSLRGTK